MLHSAQVMMGPPQPQLFRKGMSKAEKEAAAKKAFEDARKEKMHAEALEVGSRCQMSWESFCFREPVAGRRSVYACETQAASVASRVIGMVKA